MEVITYNDAIAMAYSDIAAGNPNFVVFGEGVTDPKGIFGTTKFITPGSKNPRAIESPTSENAATGICFGLSLYGFDVVHVHQRLDFCFLAMDQIINNVAKWNFLFGDENNPEFRGGSLLIRMIIGKGWGQGPQHSQAFHSMFAAIPGLEVVMPFTPTEAYATQWAAMRTKTPTICIEHRWLQNNFCLADDFHREVSQLRSDKNYSLAQTRVLVSGDKVTLVSTSFGTSLCVEAANLLRSFGISLEVVNVTYLRPMDLSPISRSIKKTNHLLVVDIGYPNFGFASEVIAKIVLANQGLIINLDSLTSLDLQQSTSYVENENSQPRVIDVIKKLFILRPEMFRFNNFNEILSLADMCDSSTKDVPSNFEIKNF